MYVSIGKHDYTKYNFFKTQGLRNLYKNYELTSEKCNLIKIGDYVDIYIYNEKNKLQVTDNDRILVDNKKYKYYGRLQDIKKFKIYRKKMFFNEVNENFLNDVNNITLYEGLIDFDAYR